jgi:hypothetical protein
MRGRPVVAHDLPLARGGWARISADALVHWTSDRMTVPCTLFGHVRDGLAELASEELQRRLWLAAKGPVDRRGERLP